LNTGADFFMADVFASIQRRQSLLNGFDERGFLIEKGTNRFSSYFLSVSARTLGNICQLSLLFSGQSDFHWCLWLSILIAG
jgi:hypothetical protein